MYEENMPFLVLTVSLCLIIFSVGVFAFYVTSSQINEAYSIDMEYTQTFTVTNPSVDQTLTTAHQISSIESVREYNMINWVSIPSDGYSFTENSIIVDANYLEG